MSKYLKDGTVDIPRLRHDLVGLVLPLSLVLDLINKNRIEDAHNIHHAALQKLKDIVAELKKSPEFLDAGQTNKHGTES